MFTKIVNMPLLATLSRFGATSFGELKLVTTLKASCRTRIKTCAICRQAVLRISDSFEFLCEYWSRTNVVKLNWCRPTLCMSAIIRIMSAPLAVWKKNSSTATSCVASSENNNTCTILGQLAPDMQRVSTFVRFCMCSVRHFFDIAMGKTCFFLYYMDDHRIFLHCVGFRTFDGS